MLVVKRSLLVGITVCLCASAVATLSAYQATPGSTCPKTPATDPPTPNFNPTITTCAPCAESIVYENIMKDECSKHPFLCNSMGGAPPENENGPDPDAAPPPVYEDKDGDGDESPPQCKCCTGWNDAGQVEDHNCTTDPSATESPACDGQEVSFHDGPCAADGNNNGIPCNEDPEEECDDSELQDDDSDGVANYMDPTPDGLGGEINLKAPMPPNVEVAMLYLKRQDALPSEVSDHLFFDDILPSVNWDMNGDGEITLEEGIAALAEALDAFDKLTLELFDASNSDFQDRSDFAQLLADWIYNVSVAGGIGAAQIKDLAELYGNNAEVLAKVSTELGQIFGPFFSAHLQNLFSVLASAQSENPNAKFYLTQDMVGGDIGLTIAVACGGFSSTACGDPIVARVNQEGYAGDPVLTSNGNFRYEQTDLMIPGRGLDFSLKRVYNSRSLWDGVLGPNWSMPLIETHAWWVQSTMGGFVRISWGDGDYSLFVRDAADHNLYNGMGGEFSKIRYLDAPSLLEQGCDQEPSLVLRKDNLLYYFCQRSLRPGIVGGVCWLSKVTDTQGNAIIFKRNSVGDVTRITDTLNREFKFKYNSSGLLSEVIDPAGRKINYEFSDINKGPAKSPGNAPALKTPGVPGGAIVRVLTGTGLGAQHSASHPSKKGRPIKGGRSELVKVRYPKTVYMNSSNHIAEARPVEEYQYHEHSERKWDRLINHNLHKIIRSGATTKEERIEIEYYDQEGDLHYDRVRSHLVAGKLTEFAYEKLADPAVAFNREYSFVTTMTDDRSVMKFRHREDGALVAVETYADDADTNAYARVFDYNADGQVSQVIQTTTTGFPLGELRSTTYAYDSINPDLFQRGNVVSVTQNPDSTNTLHPASALTTSYTYDPITNQPNSVTDPLGRKTEIVYTHEYFADTVIAQKFGVDGWAINLTQMGSAQSEPGVEWGSDEFCDFSIPNLPTLNGQAMGLFEPAVIKLPEVEIADSTGPAGPTILTVPRRFSSYNAFGQLVRQIDETGIETSHTYSGGFVSSSIVDPTDRAITQQFFYDGLGRLEREVDPVGIEKQHRYDGRDLLIETRVIPVLDPETAGVVSVSRSFYDLIGRTVAVNEPVILPDSTSYPSIGSKPQLETTISYNEADKPTSSTRIVYDQAFLDGLPALTLNSGTFEREYNAWGDLIREVNASGGITETDFDERGLVTEVRLLKQDGDNSLLISTVTSEYDAFGALTRVLAAVNSDGSGTNDATSYEYDGLGRRVVTIDDLGRSSNVELDAAGRSTRRFAKDSSGTTIADVTTSYDTHDRVVRVVASNLKMDGTIPLNEPTVLVKEEGYGVGENRILWRAQNPDGTPLVTRYEYSDLGELTREYYDGTGAVSIDSSYDATGRLTSRTFNHDNGTTGLTNPASSTYTFAFDSFGASRSATDPLNATTTTIRDVRGRVVTQVDTQGNIIASFFDTTGNLIQLSEIDAEIQSACDENNETECDSSRTTRFWYDDLGNRTLMIDAESNSTTYEYTPFGLMTKKTYADNSSTELMQYDAAARLTQQIMPGGETHAFSYDGANRLTAVTALGADADVSQSFQYDALDRIVSATDTLTVGGQAMPSTTTTTEHSSVGHVLSSATTRPAQGQLPALSSSHSFKRDEFGRVVESLSGSGLRVERSFDSLGRLDYVERVDPLGVPIETIADITMPYGMTKVRQVQLANGLAMNTSFDHNGRITNQSIGQVLSNEYEYDSLGNLTLRTRDSSNKYVESMDYDGYHRLESWNIDEDPDDGSSPLVSLLGQSWTFDRVDNHISVADDLVGPEFSPSHNTLNQYLDYGPSIDQIVHTVSGQESERSIGVSTIYSSWDALGRPLSTQLGDGSFVHYIHDASGQLVLQHSDSGSWTTFVRVSGELVESEHSLIGRREYVSGPHGIWRLLNGVTSDYLHVDPFHNVIGLIDPSSVGSELVEEYFLTPYGQLIDPLAQSIDTTPSVNNDLFFLSLPHNLETGWVRTGARLFDPALSRFTSRDPLGEQASGSNLQSYEGQNPFRWEDRTGLDVNGVQLPPVAWGLTPDDLFDATIENAPWVISNNQFMLDQLYIPLPSGEYLATLFDIVSKDEHVRNLFELDWRERYTQINERANAYYSLHQAFKALGHDVIWAGIASIVAHNVNLITIAHLNKSPLVYLFQNGNFVPFANMGNQLIFNNVTPHLRDLLASGTPLTGDAAEAWDANLIKLEQTYVEGAYETLSDSDIAELQRFVDDRWPVGIMGNFLAGSSLPPYREGSIADIQGRIDYGERVADMYREGNLHYPNWSRYGYLIPQDSAFKNLLFGPKYVPYKPPGLPPEAYEGN